MRAPWSGRTSIAVLVVACALSPPLDAAPPKSEVAQGRIPLVVGLTTVRSVTTPQGDYEVLNVITSIDPKGYGLVVSAEVPGDDTGETVKVSVRRRILAEDAANSRRMRNYYHSDDPEVFPGTVPGVSSAVVNDLRRDGKAAFTYLDVGPVFGASAIKGEFAGVLVRVKEAERTLPVLVNGRVTPLPVIHARGTLAGPAGSKVFEYVVLDDPAYPIVLRASGGGTTRVLTRIDFPEPRSSPTSLESALSKNEVVPVYGIYFSSNRADLRPESDATLAEIAAVLASHPQWTLRVDGHTDGIGTHAANMDLSRRRSAAVKDALVTRFHVAAGRLVTGGYGDSSPQAPNDTAEGRARNRRVELRRQ